MRAVREAYRSFRGAPGIWTAIVVSLALGTGANIALFSLVNGLMVRPLPVAEPDRLALVTTTGGGQSWSYPVWEQLRDSGLFHGTAAWYSESVDTSPRGRAMPVNGLIVNGDFFSTLGLVAARGRLFDAKDDLQGGGGPVAVISHRFWQSRFGGADDVVGKQIFVQRVAFTIVGVAPKGFLGPEVGTAFDVAVPLGTEPLLRQTSYSRQPGAWWLSVMVRLDPAHSRQTATAQLRALQPLMVERIGTLTDPRGSFLKDPFDLVAAAQGTSTLRERYRRPLAVLAGVALLVLIVACGNVANLLLARSVVRRREIGVRLALGASAGAIVRQLMIESAFLTAIGSGAGALLASAAIGPLVNQLSTARSAAAVDLSLDWRVFAFALAIAGVTLFVSSLLPALRAGRVSLAGSLEHGHRVLGSHSHRGANALMIGQVALTLTLLVAAGLFVRTLEHLLDQPLGVDRDRVLILRVDASELPAEPERAIELYHRFRESVRTLPQVEHASLSAMTPIGGIRWQILLDLPNSTLDEDARTVTANVISPDYFATFGTRVLAGREFQPTDERQSPPVAIVNQSFVAKFFGGESPVGRRVRQAGFPPRPAVDREIVGVVEDAAYLSLREMRQPTMYIPIAQRPLPPPAIYVSARTAAAPESIAKAAVAAVSAVSADVRVSVSTLKAQVDDSLAQERLVATLSGSFGMLALLLAAVGLYGATSHSVGQRRRELGIRLAIGAPRLSVIVLILGRVAALLAIGISIGAALSVSVAPAVASLLYGVVPRDTVTLVSAAALLACVGLVAGLLPAVAAARLDPADVLRRQ